MHTVQKLCDDLNKAISFEEEEYKLFLKMAKTAKEPFVRNLFATLADEDQDHTRRIAQIFREVTKANAFPLCLPESKTSPWKTVLQELLPQSRKKVKFSDQSALKTCMTLERKGYILYDSFVKAPQDDIDRKFFEELRDEEEGHYLLLQGLEKFIENPVDWFGEEEHHIFEGDR